MTAIERTHENLHAGKFGMDKIDDAARILTLSTQTATSRVSAVLAARRTSSRVPSP